MTWQRLEAGAVDPELTEGLAACVADPLWFLARQWQVGEFRGEDAATPILVEAEIATGPITTFWIADGKGGREVVERGALGTPLEALAEREPVTAGPAALALRLESGSALLRRLASVGATHEQLAAIRKLFAIEPGALRDPAVDADLDAAGAAGLRLLARVAADGRLVRDKVEGHGGDPTAIPELAPFAAEVSAWLAQEATLFSEVALDAPTAWSARRQEYRFGLTGRVGERVVELTAPGYPGGHLDGHHVDVASVKEAPGSIPGKPPVVPKATKSLRVLPLPLRFGGMPASRWWEFEDGDAYVADMAGGPDDLARSVVAAYSAVAGGDWFVVPCALESGSLAQVTAVRVIDDFGLTTAVPAAAVRDHQAAPERPWRWLELTGDPSVARGHAPLTYLPPVTATVEEGRILEAVELRRDETANLAWAIERTVECASGRPIDRTAGPRPAPLPPPEGGAWRYQMATDVPDHWVPLVPVRISGDRPAVVLRRGRIAATSDSANRARGRILEPERPFIVHEDEVPSGGVRVTRRFQLARSADGDVHVWVGRRKRPSGGPMARTPLRFDELTGYNVPASGQASAPDVPAPTPTPLPLPLPTS